MKSRKQSGFSMVMVLVALGLVSVTAFTSLGYVAYQKQQMKRIFIQSWNDDFRMRVEDILASPTTCTQILPTQNISVVSGSDIPLQLLKVNTILNDRILSIKTARISDIIAIPSGNPTLPNTFFGKLNLTMEFKDAGLNADKALQGVVGEVAFNIKIYGDHMSTALKNVKCSSQGSDNALYVSQICGLYGGILTDGVHCDFPLVNSQIHAAQPNMYKTENSSAAYLNLATSNSSVPNYVNRISMPEMLCYLDTLLALSPPVPIATVAAPAKIRNYTKYCAHPGGGSIGRVSVDVKNIFQNLKL